jgi:metal-responsive CopG/Arc/MetJ family transcriptional regulator
METAVSIPDEVFEAAEQLARRRNMSRSELYTAALRAMLVDDAEVGDGRKDVDDTGEEHRRDRAETAAAARQLFAPRDS